MEFILQNLFLNFRLQLKCNCMEVRELHLLFESNFISLEKSNSFHNSYHYILWQSTVFDQLKRVFYQLCSPVYTSNFYVTSFIYLPVNAPSTRALFIWKQKIGDWNLWMSSKKLPILYCLVYTDNFLYVTIFICHIKINTPVFQQI